MPRIVQKFGGTSVADVEHIRRVVQRVKREVDAGNEVAVVVSAMAGETDRLDRLVREMVSQPDSREYDVVASTGEQISAALTALALQEIGVAARSWLGWQVPLRTGNSHSRARIESIDRAELDSQLASGEVPVIAGFQGLSPEGRITTLGRGGSDISAVALAAAISADRCDIYTDVDGVYTADPRIVAKARKLDKITYEEMLELAAQGANVLQTRSVRIAMSYGVPLRVLSSFNDRPGTLVVDEDQIVEQEIVSGIAYSRDDAKITVTNIADRPGVAAHLFGPLAKAEINVDMIVQNVSHESGATDLTFTVPKGELDRTITVLETSKDELDFQSIESDSNVVKISVIGVGMRSHAGVAQQMFSALAEKSINIQVISTSDIKISVLVAEEYTELALRALHTAYGLDAK